MRPSSLPRVPTPVRRAAASWWTALTSPPSPWSSYAAAFRSSRRWGAGPAGQAGLHGGQAATSAGGFAGRTAARPALVCLQTSSNAATVDTQPTLPPRLLARRSRWCSPAPCAPTWTPLASTAPTPSCGRRCGTWAWRSRCAPPGACKGAWPPGRQGLGQAACCQGVGRCGCSACLAGTARAACLVWLAA